MSKLTRQQQSSFLMSEVLDYSCVIEATEGKYLMYSLKQTSSNPFSVQISNVGEKTNKPIVQLTLMEDSVKVKKLVDDSTGDKLPDKYVFLKDGLHIASHSMAIEAIALPYFLETAIQASQKNLVAVQWLFMSLLCTRLQVEYTSTNEKATTKPFTVTDIAWSFANCIDLAIQHNLPTPIVDMLKADFAQVPEDVRAPFEKVLNTIAVETKELPSDAPVEPTTVKSNGKVATTK